ncbi:pleurocidin-like peptide WF3 [Toxotes jaculatrix]|uniref:pleurocidin-like peptide WF3 n=1 Tax=Toxotes jaculatrix TaxID=941984 RepID=UPI001B3AD2A1|nr:pleurocidin-like peptide WF3 [Toxotes jaculatrix]
MKCTVVFLVLSMVVLMAEPGECILGMLFHGAVHVGKLIHGLIHGGKYNEKQDQLEQLDKRSVDYNPGRPGFD